MSQISTRYQYYVVQNDEVVGRYGPDLEGALKHLTMFGRSTENGLNRAIIPVLNGDAQHPDSIKYKEYALHSSDSPYPERCDHWESDQMLTMMQRLAEREHRIMMPFNHRHHMIGSVPFQGHRADIREACIQHFEKMADLADHEIGLKH